MHATAGRGQVKARSTAARAALVGMAAVAAALASPLAADKGERAAPEVYAKLLECRSITDDAQRLACFDRSVSALAEAEAAKDVRIVSREDVKRTRRSLFGFVASGFGLFGDDGEDEIEQEEIKEITATITAVSGGTGGYVFRLDDGSVWAQNDNTFLNRPAAGKTIVIRRAALGSYMAKIDGGVGFRIKRRS